MCSKHRWMPNHLAKIPQFFSLLGYDLIQPDLGIVWRPSETTTTGSELSFSLLLVPGQSL